MNEYFFMYVIGFVAVLFAVFQDLKTREIANWLTFSLVAFVLSYRAIYSIYSNNFMFFIYGLTGVFLFVGLGYLFYYSKVFAGGDAKLLFGLGGIFPYLSFYDYIYYGLGFILVLFASGVLYTLVYSLFLVRKNFSKFRKPFYEQLREKKLFFILSFVISVLFLIVNFNNSWFTYFFVIFLFLSPLLFAYVKAVEKSCMIQLVSPKILTEGDWLERDVSVNGRIIKKTFQGLTAGEIIILRKSGKKVWIKTGVPFAPSFLIALTIFVAVLRYSSWEFF